MDDTTAASAGFALAGVALAASLLGWPRYELAAILAGATLVAFALRRYGTVPRPVGSIAAAVGAVGVTVVSIFAAVLSGGQPGAVGAALAGGACAVAAYADLTGLRRDALVERAGATARGVALGAAGIVGIYAWALLVFVIVQSVAPGELGGTERAVLSTFASGAGTVTVVVLYFRWSDRGLSFLDLRWPDLRGLGYAVGGTLLILVGNLAIGLAFQRTDVESARHSIVRAAEGDPALLLALIPLAYLVIAPGEELLFRNVIQKALRETFSPVAGIVVASAIFAAVHLPAYSNPGEAFQATLATLAVVFVLALVLGAVYERTGNLVVPILVHGTFNAIAFAATYVELTRGIAP